MHVDFRINAWGRIEIPKGYEEVVKEALEKDEINNDSDLAKILIDNGAEDIQTSIVNIELESEYGVHEAVIEALTVADKVIYQKGHHKIGRMDQDKVKAINSGESIALIWSVGDVMEKAEELEIELTEQEAKDVLSTIDAKQDANIGVSWEEIEHYLWEFEFDRVKEKGEDSE